MQGRAPREISPEREKYKLTLCVLAGELTILPGDGAPSGSNIDAWKLFGKRPTPRTKIAVNCLARRRIHNSTVGRNPLRALNGSQRSNESSPGLRHR